MSFLGPKKKKKVLFSLFFNSMILNFGSSKDVDHVLNGKETFLLGSCHQL
jgi:hypothetical protein